MRQFRKLITAIAMGLLGFTLFSCNSMSSKEIPSNVDGKEGYRLIAFVDEGDGQFHKIDVHTTDLRAANRGPQTMGSAIVTGLGAYFHNESCEVGINPVPSSNKKVKEVIFKYTAAYSHSDLPTTRVEYLNRKKPINPNNYQVNFRFNVVGDVYMYVTMDSNDGVDVVIDDNNDNGGGNGSGNGGGNGANTGLDLGIDK